MTAIVLIPNMTCGGCAKGVAATLRAAAPGVAPRFDLERRSVALDGAADLAPIIAALRADGWEARAEADAGHA